MDKHLLSFAVNDDGTFLSMHADVAGLDLLIRSLVNLRQSAMDGECEHVHLFSDPDLGGELTTTKLQNQPYEATSIMHLKLYGWTDEWAKRHGLVTD